MSRKTDAIDFRDHWQKRRLVYPESVIEPFSHLPHDKIKDVCLEEFGPEGAEIAVQALITKAHRSPADFGEVASYGQWNRAPHLDLLNDIFIDACFNQRFYIVSVSVRHGKSLFVSKWAPAWYLAKFPDRKVLQISSTHRLAQGFSKDVRDILEDTSKDFFGLTLNEASASKFGFFEHNGELNSRSVHSQIIGMGGDLMIIDDPYKSMLEALNNTANEKVKDWWVSNLESRLQPGASMILVMARWSENDLAAWLLERSRQNPEAPQWVEVKLPAIWDSDNQDLLFKREKGDPLWPEFWSKEALAQRRAAVGELVWQCQYQQNPLSYKDSMFPIDKWGTIARRDLPRFVHLVRYWDLSAGGEESDFVCGVLMGIDAHGSYYVLDVAREKFTGEDADLEVMDFVREISREDYAREKKTLFFFEEVPGAGKAISKTYERQVFKGLPVEPYRKQGSKEANAFPLASHVKGNNVFLVVESKTKDPYGGWDIEMPDWGNAFLGELASFPGKAENDDQVDAASGAHIKLDELFYGTERDGSGPARFVNPQKEQQKREGSGIDPDKILSQGLSAQTKEKPARIAKARVYRKKLNEPSIRQKKRGQSKLW